MHKHTHSFFILAFLTMLIPGPAVRADLDQDLKAVFSVLVEQECYSSIPHEIDRIWKDVEKVEAGEQPVFTQYHDTMRCLMNDALFQAADGIEAEVAEQFDRFEKEYRSPLDESCDSELTVDKIQEAQRRLGFQTSCEGDISSHAYSSCRIGETMLNEFCGYRMYLWARQKDLGALKEEHDELNQNLKSEGLSTSNNIRALYDREMEKAEKTMTQSLDFYRQFVTDFRQHAWLRAFEQVLQTIQQSMLTFRGTIDIYPDKFIDATRSTCD